MKQKGLLLLITALGGVIVFKGLDTIFKETFPQVSLWFLGASIGYILGSIPFALILTRSFTNQDIRKIGSGNVGATNVLRTGKKMLAAITLFLDLMKGVLAVYCAHYCVQTMALDDSITPLFAASGAVLGHCFPIWLAFKGGKAVATSAGVLFALNPLVGALSGGVWILTLILSRYSSLAALLSSLTTPLSAFFIMGDQNLGIFSIFLAVLIFSRHGSNIKRLLKGEEPKIA